MEGKDSKNDNSRSNDDKHFEKKHNKPTINKPIRRVKFDTPSQQKLELDRMTEQVTSKYRHEPNLYSIDPVSGACGGPKNAIDEEDPIQNLMENLLRTKPKAMDASNRMNVVNPESEVDRDKTFKRPLPDLPDELPTPFIAASASKFGSTNQANTKTLYGELETEISVTLNRKNGFGASGLGFTTDERIGKITGILAGGPAQLSGKIEVGDTIHAINGHQLCSGAEVYPLLSASPGSVNLTLKRTVQRGFKKNSAMFIDSHFETSGDKQDEAGYGKNFALGHPSARAGTSKENTFDFTQNLTENNEASVNIKTSKVSSASLQRDDSIPSTSSTSSSWHSTLEDFVDMRAIETDPSYRISDLNKIKDFIKELDSDPYGDKNLQENVPEGWPGFLYSLRDYAKKVAFPAIVMSKRINKGNNDNLVPQTSNTSRSLDTAIPFIAALNASIHLGASLLEVYRAFGHNNKQTNDRGSLDEKLNGFRGLLEQIAIDADDISKSLNSIMKIGKKVANKNDDLISQQYETFIRGLKQGNVSNVDGFLQCLEDSKMEINTKDFERAKFEEKKEQAIFEFQYLIAQRQTIEVMKQMKCFFMDISESEVSNMEHYCKNEGHDYLEFLDHFWEESKVLVFTADTSLKIPTVLVLGKTGTGKSSLCNVFAGKMAESTMEYGGFPVSAEQDSCTQNTTTGDYCYFGQILRPVKLVDTPGFDDPNKNQDGKIIADLVAKLKDMEEIHQILIAVNGTNPRLDGSMKAMIDIFQRMFGKEIWSNIGIVFTKLSMDKNSVAKRLKHWKKNDQKFAKDYAETIKKEFNIEEQHPNLETFFIDSCYNEELDEEKSFFEGEMDRLWIAINQKEKFDTRKVERVMTEFEELKRTLKAKKQEMKQQQKMIREYEKREERRLELDKEEARIPEYGYTWSELKTGLHYERRIDDYRAFIRKVSPMLNHFEHARYFDEKFWTNVKDKWDESKDGLQNLEVVDMGGNEATDFGSSLSFSLSIVNTTKYFLKGKKNLNDSGVVDNPIVLWASTNDGNLRPIELTEFTSFVIPPFTRERLVFLKRKGMFIKSVRSILSFFIASHLSSIEGENNENIMIMFDIRGKGNNSYATGFPDQEIDKHEARRVFKNNRGTNEYYSKDFVSTKRESTAQAQGSQIFWPPENQQSMSEFKVTYSIGNHKNCNGSFYLKKNHQCKQDNTCNEPGCDKLQ